NEKCHSCAIRRVRSVPRAADRPPAARARAVPDARRVHGLRVVAHEDECAQAPHTPTQQDVASPLETVKDPLPPVAWQLRKAAPVAKQWIDAEHAQEHDDLTLRLARPLRECTLDDALDRRPAGL